MDDEDSQIILRRIMEDGTFDELRKTIIERLKQDVRILLSYLICHLDTGF